MKSMRSAKVVLTSLTLVMLLGTLSGPTSAIGMPVFDVAAVTNLFSQIKNQATQIAKAGEQISQLKDRIAQANQELASIKALTMMHRPKSIADFTKEAGSLSSTTQGAVQLSREFLSDANGVITDVDRSNLSQEANQANGGNQGRGAIVDAMMMNATEVHSLTAVEAENIINTEVQAQQAAQAQPGLLDLHSPVQSGWPI